MYCVGSPLSDVPPTNPLLGEVLDGRYRIVREIGSGGMSVVYEATHVKINRTVAIKILHREMASDPEVVGRFLNEARAVGAFGHPNIVASTDFGELPGHVPYQVLEYLDGRTLSQEIETEGPLPLDRVARIALQIASALDAAHVRNVIHRDLSSTNIFLVKRGENPDHVKVLDFGISKFLAAGEGGPKTRRGLTMGTPEFMAPEQISNPEGVDARADVYALGIIMYHMLAGRHPFDRAPLQALFTQIVMEAPAAIQHREVPDELFAVVLRALAKDPADRFPSMRALGLELERVADEIAQGAGWNDSLGVPSFHSGAKFLTAPIAISRSGPISLPPRKTGPIAAHASGPITAPPVVAAPAAPVTQLVVGTGGGRKLLMAILLIAIGSASSVGVLTLRAKQRQASAATAVAAAPPASAVPPALSPRAGPVDVDVRSPTAHARVTLRGRTHRLPFSEAIAPGSEPEAVEVTAPGREGKRFWLTFDHPITLAASLPEGRGVEEASAEETVIALGGSPVDDADQGAAADDAASVAPETNRHASGGHRHGAGKPRPEATVSPGEQAGSEAAPPPVNAGAAQAPKTGSVAASGRPLAPSALGDDTLPPSEAFDIVAPTGHAARAAGIDPAETQALVRSHLPEIRRCYERGKMDDPELRGRVTLRISVAASGAVASAAVEASTLRSSAVESCIVATVKGWRFPAPTGGPAVISYPFNLR